MPSWSHYLAVNAQIMPTPVGAQKYIWTFIYIASVYIYTANIDADIFKAVCCCSAVLFGNCLGIWILCLHVWANLQISNYMDHTYINTCIKICWHAASSSCTTTKSGGNSPSLMDLERREYNVLGSDG